MMSLPFQAGFAPDRWKKVTDIMLQKEIGDSRCHRLHIIALFESDLYHAKRILIGRKLLHHIEDKKHAAQYAVWLPTRQTLSFSGPLQGPQP
jgi:hypothetical protein